MSDELLDTLEALERRGWHSLCDGTAGDFYGSVTTSDGMMVLSNGAWRLALDTQTPIRS